MNTGMQLSTGNSPLQLRSHHTVIEQTLIPYIAGMTQKDNNIVHVTSEVGTLKRLLVHSPDSGLGRVVPSKAQDWLFEDIVHLDTIRRKEYDYYTKVLLYFLDPEKIKGKLQQVDATSSNRDFYKPEKADFFRSDKVIELEWLLAEILEDHEIKLKLVASVCAVENCSYNTQTQLLELPPARPLTLELPCAQPTTPEPPRAHPTTLKLPPARPNTPHPTNDPPAKPELPAECFNPGNHRAATPTPQPQACRP